MSTNQTDDDNASYRITPLGVMLLIIGEAKAREIMAALSAKAASYTDDGDTPAITLNGGGSFISIHKVG